ncbi:MAK10-like protein [Tanacetum coccineum]
MGDENPIRTLGDYSKPSHEGYRNTIELPDLLQNVLSWHRFGSKLHFFMDLSIFVTREPLTNRPGFKLRDHATYEESWALLEDLALLWDNESWNGPRISLRCQGNRFASDVPSTSDRRVLTTLKYCMKDPDSLVEYTSSRTNEVGGLVSEFMASQDARLSKFEANFKQQQSKMTNKIDTISINVITIHPKQPEESQDNEPDVRKLNSMLESLGLVPQSSNTKFICTKEDDGEIMFIEIIRDDDEPQNKSPNEGEGTTTKGPAVEYFDTFPTRDELTYHKYLMCGLIPSIFLQNPIITEGCSSNLKIPCNIGHVHVEKAYIDLNSPLNIMTRMMYNWIMRIKLNPRENANGGISNFTGRIKGLHVFVGNFTYVVDFMIVEDISSIIDPRLSQVVLGRPFIEISNMTHDLPEGVVRFTNGNNEVAYKMPHKIEQYNSLSNLEKKHRIGLS